MNVPRISLFSCLAVFLSWPAITLVVVLTGSSVAGWFALGTFYLWLASLEALLLLCAAYIKEEPDLIRTCLKSMGFFFLVLLLFALVQPSICA